MDTSEENRVHGDTPTEIDNPVADTQSSDELPVERRKPTTYEPKDSYKLVYFVFVLVAAGVLFPWNSFILAIDYFRFLYPTQHVENVIPYTDLTFTLLAVLFTVLLVNVLPLQLRIGFGYLMFASVLAFIPSLDFGIHNCTVDTKLGFGFTVVAVVSIALGGGVQQSSYYGLAGMLPPRYTQALMLGESTAGIVVSILRIITKASAKSEREGAIAFFYISLIYIIFCIVCQVYLYRSKYVRFYINKCKSSSSSSDEDSTDSESDDKKLLPSTEDSASSDSPSLWKRIKGSVRLRWQVMRSIWKIALSTFLILFVTLLLFPGITSDIQNCDIQDWPPVIMAAVFNVFDGISRIFALIHHKLNPNLLILVSCSRFILIPFLILCVSPSPSSPIFPNPLWAGIVLTAVLGLSNGYFATVCMMEGPMSVKNPKLRELAGNMMVFFLLSGLTAGAIFATGLTPFTELSAGEKCTNVSAEFLCSLKSNINSSAF